MRDFFFAAYYNTFARFYHFELLGKHNCRFVAGADLLYKRANSNISNARAIQACAASKAYPLSLKFVNDTQKLARFFAADFRLRKFGCADELIGFFQRNGKISVTVIFVICKLSVQPLLCFPLFQRFFSREQHVYNISFFHNAPQIG